MLGGKQLELYHPEAASAAGSKTDEGSKRASTIWQFDLPPYDIVAIKVSDPQFRLNGIIHAPDASVIEKIESEVSAIETKLSQLNNASRTEPLSVLGGDFERWIEGGRPEGWTTSSLPQVTIQQESALPHTGLYCVAIENRNQAQVSAWLQSEPIQVPESGRIVVQAWLRTSLSTAQPQNMRLSLVGRLRDGRRYQRTLPINPQTAGSDLAIDWGKRPVTMFCDGSTEC